jgi:hypothetical protein
MNALRGLRLRDEPSALPIKKEAEVSNAPRRVFDATSIMRKLVPGKYDSFLVERVGRFVS